VHLASIAIGVVTTTRCTKVFGSQTEAAASKLNTSVGCARELGHPAGTYLFVSARSTPAVGPLIHELISGKKTSNLQKAEKKRDKHNKNEKKKCQMNEHSIANERKQYTQRATCKSAGKENTKEHS
jgi:hypothetical protein